jgi:hypothetical protein
LLGDIQRVIDFDATITQHAFELVSCTAPPWPAAPTDPIRGAVDPAVDNAGVLRVLMCAVGDESGSGSDVARLERYCWQASRGLTLAFFRSSRTGRASCFLLDHHDTVPHSAGDAYVISSQPHEVASSQLAVDRAIEQREIASALFKLQSDPDRSRGDLGEASLLASSIASWPWTTAEIRQLVEFAQVAKALQRCFERGVIAEFQEAGNAPHFGVEHLRRIAVCFSALSSRREHDCARRIPSLDRLGRQRRPAAN